MHMLKAVWWGWCGCAGAGADDDEPWTPEEDPPHHDYDEHSTEDAEGEGAAADSVENDPDYQAFDGKAHSLTLLFCASSKLGALALAGCMLAFPDC